MLRHHCGAENAAQAKFCKGCGESLSAPVAPVAAEHPACPTCGTDNPAGARFCPQCGTQRPDLAGSAAMPPAQQPTQAPVHAAPAPSVAGAAQRQTKGGAAIWIGALALVLVIAGGAAWWWSTGQHDALPLGAADTAPAGQAAAVTPAPSAAPAAVVTEQAPAKPAEPAAAAVAAGDTAGKPHPADARSARSAHPDGKRAAPREPEVAKRETPRPQPEPRQQAAAVPSEGRSVQQICAGKSNFVARDFCEAKECMRREFTNSRYCVQLRAQHNQNASGNGVP